MQPDTRPRQPALDGLRGVSVALVLCFHGGWAWMRGGYVGVSVFFTLSGFLITRLLIEEHANLGGIDLGRFWSRRLRRLLPAGLACIGFVIAARQAGAFQRSPGLRADVLGALGQVANWVQLAGSTSYAEQINGGGGPLDHFWSLAIEEQFYWIWPLTMIAVLRSRRPHLVLVALAAGSGLLAPIVAGVWGSDAAYWATPARIGEILIGAALAGSTTRAGSTLRPQVRWLGPPALAIILWCAVRWPTSGGPAYSGWLPALALASAALVASLTVGGAWSRLWEWRPLVALGTISYGVYVWHWPVFLLLRGGARPTLLRFALQVAVTLAAAAVSYVVLERPIRTWRPAIRRDAVIAGVAIASLATAAIAVPLAADDPFADPEQASGQLTPRPASRIDATVRTPSTAVDPTPPSTSPSALVDLTTGHLPPPPARPVRILVVGDSVTWSIGNGLVAWAYQHPEYAAVGQLVAVSCGFVRTGSIPAFDGLGYDDKCNEMLDVRLPDAVRELQPDVVMVMSTRADVEDRIWEPGGQVLASTSAESVRRRRDEFDAFVEHLLFMGVASVVWVEPPTARAGELPDQPMMDSQAMESLRRTIVDVTDAWAPRARSLDLAGWYAASGIDDDSARPDGLHFQPEPALEVADRLLAPALITAALAATG